MVHKRKEHLMAKYAYPISVRARLLRLGHTQRDVAKALGYSRSYISMVVSGKYPAPEVRKKIEDLILQWEGER